MENKNVKERITWDRLSEIATQCLHALYEAEPIEAMEYFRDTLDLTEEEREYFEVPTETEEEDDEETFEEMLERQTEDHTRPHYANEWN